MSNLDKREALIIPEKKEKIEKIKAKYNNMQMSNDVALKINRYEVANKILKAATAAVGVVTVIDLFVTDPIAGLDEAALATITGLLGYSTTLVNNKIEDLAKTGSAQVQVEEINKLTEQIGTVANKVKQRKHKAKTK